MKCCNCHVILAVDMAGVACRGLVCVCVRLKKDIGMTIRKSIVVSFLPSLVPRPHPHLRKSDLVSAVCACA